MSKLQSSQLSNQQLKNRVHPPWLWAVNQLHVFTKQAMKAEAIFYALNQQFEAVGLKKWK